ncbi:hypothetical protein F3J45_15050 [Pantoea sp. Ap-967]|nr:hypothetical protein [Pantoea sp. Ap-967]
MRDIFRKIRAGLASVGAGLTREASTAVHGTGCAGVRGASPLLQRVAARLRAMFPARHRSPRGLGYFPQGTAHALRFSAPVKSSAARAAHRLTL